jgi:hypothetical protein
MVVTALTISGFGSSILTDLKFFFSNSKINMIFAGFSDKLEKDVT